MSHAEYIFGRPWGREIDSISFSSHLVLGVLPLIVIRGHTMVKESTCQAETFMVTRDVPFSRGASVTRRIQ
jgi:hypothetical protein